MLCDVDWWNARWYESGTVFVLIEDCVSDIKRHFLYQKLYLESTNLSFCRCALACPIGGHSFQLLAPNIWDVLTGFRCSDDWQSGTLCSVRTPAVVPMLRISVIRHSKNWSHTDSLKERSFTSDTVTDWQIYYLLIYILNGIGNKIRFLIHSLLKTDHFSDSLRGWSAYRCLDTLVIFWYL